MKNKLPLLPWLLALLCLPGPAFAQGTAFSYQGRLSDAGLPVTGAYDFTFTVYDSEAHGLVVAGPITRDAVAVSGGLFNVSLDFGAGVFEGAALWLEISVSPAGAGAPTVLTPRTALLPSPYSVFASRAGGVSAGSLTPDHLNTGGVPPAPGQFLAYDGAGLFWSDPGVAVGQVWSLNGASAYYNSGNVGIGTTTPAHRLSLAGGPTWTANGWTGALALPNASALGWHANAGGQRFGLGVSSGGLYWFRTASDPGTAGSAAQYDMILTDSGRLGIGTTTPGSKLTVRTTGAFSAYGIEHTDGNVRLSTYLDDGYGAWFGTRTAHALNFYVNDGLPSLTIGVGGATTMSPIGGYGDFIVGTPNGESGFSIRAANRADVRFNGSSLKLVAATGTGPPSSANGIAVTTAGNVGIGTDAPLAKLDVRGTTRTCILTITGGCDLAEPFPLKEELLAKGSVVVIDDEHAGRLKQSTHAYDRRVAGIVSGANGISPGISLQQDGVLDQGENVALTGRVYVRADATNGAITPGDLLTTSDLPGHAMKVSDHARAQGAILGKAMSALESGQGLVLVLVTLQ